MTRPPLLWLVVLAGCAEAHGAPRPAPPEPPTDAEVCGGAVCGSGEECCRLTARCVPVGDPSCAIPAGTDVPRPCTRASDCDAGEVCEMTDPVSGIARCAGYVGTCVDRRASCGSGGGAVCGCDGRTYGDACDAYAAGVEVGHDVACGTEIHDGMATCGPEGYVCPPHTYCELPTRRCMRESPLIACGIDEQCPTGQRCCGWTGECFDPSRPASCARPPDGTFGPCTDDVDCQRREGSYWWTSSTEPRSFCEGETCGGSGGCVYPPPLCDGVLAPVCGCGGNEYQNECEAHAAEVAIDPDGACAGP